MLFKNFLLVGLGGMIGSVCRYAIALIFKNTYFPFSTLIVNVIGSFIIGLILGISLKNPTFNNEWRLFLATGICGGFTTFSAFSYENMSLLKSGNYSYFFLYVGGSVVFGIFAAWFGMLLIK